MPYSWSSSVLSIFLEAIERIYDPPHIEHTNRLLIVSVLGFLVNFVGVVFFHEFHVGHSHDDGACPMKNHGCETQPCGDGHRYEEFGTNANLRGVYLHILADTLGSVGVIISSLIIKYKGWLMADPVCSLFIAALIIVSVWPLLQQTSRTLTLQSPFHPETLLREILTLPAVLEYRDPHFWTLAGNSKVCSIRVLIHEGAVEQSVLQDVNMLCRRAGFTIVTVQVERQRFATENPHHFQRFSDEGAHSTMSTHVICLSKKTRHVTPSYESMMSDSAIGSVMCDGE